MNLVSPRFATEKARAIGSWDVPCANPEDDMKHLLLRYLGGTIINFIAETPKPTDAFNSRPDYLGR
jgi:hypothetical protein